MAPAADALGRTVLAGIACRMIERRTERIVAAAPVQPWSRPQLSALVTLCVLLAVMVGMTSAGTPWRHGGSDGGTSTPSLVVDALVLVLTAGLCVLVASVWLLTPGSKRRRGSRDALSTREMGAGLRAGLRVLTAGMFVVVAVIAAYSFLLRRAGQPSGESPVGRDGRRPCRDRARSRHRPGVGRVTDVPVVRALPDRRDLDRRAARPRRAPQASWTGSRPSRGQLARAGRPCRRGFHRRHRARPGRAACGHPRLRPDGASIRRCRRPQAAGRGTVRVRGPRASRPAGEPGRRGPPRRRCSSAPASAGMRWGRRRRTRRSPPYERSSDSWGSPDEEAPQGVARGCRTRDDRRSRSRSSQDRAAAGHVGIYLCAIAALALAALVVEIAGAFPHSEAATPRLQRRPERVAQLESVDHLLASAEASAGELHERLRPLLRAVAAARLGRRGIALDREPARARGSSASAAWEIVRPDREPPADRSARGCSRASCARSSARWRRSRWRSPCPRCEARAADILDEVERAVVGKRHQIELVLMGLLADGHVLIEDLPGARQDAHRAVRRECLLAAVLTHPVHART